MKPPLIVIHKYIYNLVWFTPTSECSLESRPSSSKMFTAVCLLTSIVCYRPLSCLCTDCTLPLLYNVYTRSYVDECKPMSYTDSTVFSCLYTHCTLPFMYNVHAGSYVGECIPMSCTDCTLLACLCTACTLTLLYNVHTGSYVGECTPMSCGVCCNKFNSGQLLY